MPRARRTPARGVVLPERADEAGNALVGVVVGLCVWVLPLLALLIPPFRVVAASLLVVYAVVLLALAAARLRRIAARRNALGRQLSSATGTSR